MVATGDARQTRQVPIDEAARLLGLSRRTIERRLNRGTLTGSKTGGRWLVDVPPSELTTTATRQEADTGEVDVPVSHLSGVSQRAEALAVQLAEATVRGDALAAQVSQLSGQLAEVTRQCDSLAAQVSQLSATGDVLRQRVEELTSERDYLRSALAAALTLQQKALPERTEQGRHWWWPWGRP